MVAAETGWALIGRQQHVLVIQGDGVHGHGMDVPLMQRRLQLQSVDWSPQGGMHAIARIGAAQHVAVGQEMPPAHTRLNGHVALTQLLHGRCVERFISLSRRSGWRWP